MKDKSLLLFWGLLAGAVFVGCILGFGGAVNWINAHHAAGISAGYVKTGLVLVICGAFGILFKVGLYFNNKITRKQAEKVFPPQLLVHIYQSPLAKAVVQQREDKLDELRFLPEQTRAACVNAPVQGGITPLHIAAECGLDSMCRHLLKCGARIDARDNFGGTPLHAAAACQSGVKVIKTLVEHGADLRLKDAAGMTPAALAEKYKHYKIAAYLKLRGL